MRRQQLAPCNAAANAPDAAQLDESDILVLEAADDGDDVLMSEDDAAAPAAPMGQDDVEDVDQVDVEVRLAAEIAENRAASDQEVEEERQEVEAERQEVEAEPVAPNRIEPQRAANVIRRIGVVTAAVYAEVFEAAEAEAGDAETRFNSHCYDFLAAMRDHRRMLLQRQ